MSDVKKLDVKMYEVRSTIDNWPHGSQRYDGVTVTWFVNRRPVELGDIRYDELIEDYDPETEHPTYGELYIQELFTEDEMKALCSYLKERHNRGNGRDAAMRRHKTLNQDIARLPNYESYFYPQSKNFRKRSEAEIYQAEFIAMASYRSFPPITPKMAMSISKTGQWKLSGFDHCR